MFTVLNQADLFVSTKGLKLDENSKQLRFTVPRQLLNTEFTKSYTKVIKVVTDTVKAITFSQLV